MSRAAVAACVLGLTLMSACGGEDDGVKSASEALIGTWTVDTNDGYHCSRGFTFAPDGKYEYAYVCELTTGEFGYEAIVGNYVVEDDSEITLTATGATCEWVTKTPLLATFKHVGEQLSIRFDTGAYIMNKTEYDGMGGGVTIVMGCFDADRQLVARPITKL